VEIQILGEFLIGLKILPEELLEELGNASLATRLILLRFAFTFVEDFQVRLQTQPQGADRLYNGVLDCLKKTLEGEGIGGLYKGVGSPLAGTAALGIEFQQI
jgi:hypothetical protein